jgi:hypothetical protein
MSEDKETLGFKISDKCGIFDKFGMTISEEGIYSRGEPAARRERGCKYQTPIPV